MTYEKPGIHTDRELNRLAEEILASLATRFPVCMASDEFHFFPQALDTGTETFHWDDFSPEAMTDLFGCLQEWKSALAPFLSRAAPFAQNVEADMLHRVLKTLNEQFELVQVQESQPTFYLTIVGIGMAEALESGNPMWTQRLENLPAFLDQARRNLIRMPRLFRDIGLEMLVQQRSWIQSLNMPDGVRAPIFDALGRFQTHLEQTSVQEDFLPEIDLYARIAREHMGCQFTPEEISDELETEIEQTRSILEKFSQEDFPGIPWQVVLQRFPRPPVPKGGIGELYHNIIAELAAHCDEQGLIARNLARQCPVEVKPVPDFMRPVRSNAAYSMPPVHPPAGGTFFILESGQNDTLPADYALLAAHETYPGHHLLDTCRWLQSRAIRRHIEFPLFYEGWASFGEELMFETGFFSGRRNRMLMAKRRFWRAIRGKIDFEIHMRRRTLDEAASMLTSTGMPQDRAIAMVRRYSLKPGYQLAYTIGRRRFWKFYQTWKRGDEKPAAFARKVLEQGEIGFHHLEQILIEGG